MPGTYSTEADRLARAGEDLASVARLALKRLLSRWLAVTTAVSLLIASVGAGMTVFSTLPSLQDLADDAVSTTRDNLDNAPLPLGSYGAANATSFTQDTTDSNVFWPQGAFDNDIATGWAECKSGREIYPGSSRKNYCTRAGTQGEGETLTVPLSTPVDIKLIKIRNGYQKDNDVFRANPRLREVRVVLETVDRGDVVAEVVLSDTMGYQDLGAPRDVPGVTSLSVTILSTYPGEDTLAFPDDPYSDTTITDIELIPVKVIR